MIYTNRLLKSMGKALLVLLSVITGNNCTAQGTWTPLAHHAPYWNYGGMILLSDGTVLAKSNNFGTSFGTNWCRLTPDSAGSYVNGTWSAIAPMWDDRMDFSSQLLRDGRLYVAGGEYGSGKGRAEVYNPVSNSWLGVPSRLPTVPDTFSDANSMLLPDGRVLQATLGGSGNGNYIYDPVSNTFSAAATSIGGHDESSWVKLPDNSILFADVWSSGTNTTERYIPSLGTWVADAPAPFAIYDLLSAECGAALMLPDGRALFFCGTGATAYYTPSGGTAPGTWAAGPAVPAHRCTIDAPAAMMVNGKILCTVTDTTTGFNIFPTPTWFYEFDYATNTFTQVTGPLGSDTIHSPSYQTSMLDLPDGSVLFSILDTTAYYIYTPSGTPLAAGKPAIDSVIKLNCDTFMATGKLFNGISEGAAYGDDWQMATNYPLVRLKTGSRVYYARTFNWNRTGIMTGPLADTTYFTLPDGLPMGSYNLEVVANGNPSAPHPFLTCLETAVTTTQNTPCSIYPNPASNELTIVNATAGMTLHMYAITGQEVNTIHLQAATQTIDIHDLPSGMYFVHLITGEGTNTSLKFIKE